jgi:predicted hotdog family 3-hydroxylacyl-ACP dehydratase
VNAAIVVPSDAAYFAGHFPGRPILPAVAELDLALQALARASGRPSLLRGIAFARWRQLVVPGDRLELSARELDDGQVRIDLRRGTELVANAEVMLGRPEKSLEPAVKASPAPHPSCAPPLDALLPHRPPMRLVTAIADEADDGLTCATSIPASCPLVTDGFAPALAGVEAAAQAAAAWEAVRRYRAGDAGPPRIGYLVALREVAFFVERIPADEELLAGVRLEAAMPPLTHYRIEVCHRGRQIVRGGIATFLARP